MFAGEPLLVAIAREEIRCPICGAGQDTDDPSCRFDFGGDFALCHNCGFSFDLRSITIILDETYYGG